MPDVSQIITWACGLLVVGAVKMGFVRLSKLESAQIAGTRELSEVREMLPERYVQKVDYKADMAELKADVKEVLIEVRGIKRA